MVSADYLPSRVHGQFTATMADEVRHGAKCPCRAAPLDGPDDPEWPYSFIVNRREYEALVKRAAPLDGLREAAQSVVDSAILTEFGPDEEFWTVHSAALDMLRAALREGETT